VIAVFRLISRIAKWAFSHIFRVVKKQGWSRLHFVLGCNASTGNAIRSDDDWWWIRFQGLAPLAIYFHPFGIGEGEAVAFFLNFLWVAVSATKWRKFIARGVNPW